MKSLEQQLAKAKTDAEKAKLCLEAVKKSGNGNALYFVPEKFRTAKLCNVAVRKNVHALGYVPEKLKTAKLCNAAVRKNVYALQYVPEKLKTLKMYIEAVKKDAWVFISVPEHLREQVTKATGIKGTDMLPHEYESTLEKDAREIFKKEVERICPRLMKLCLKARLKGILSLEDDIDKKKVLERDLLEMGIKLATAGETGYDIENYLNSWIEANCNNSVAYYEKILASIIKTGILCIKAGDNPSVAESKMIDLIPRGLIPNSLKKTLKQGGKK